MAWHRGISRSTFARWGAAALVGSVLVLVPAAPASAAIIEVDIAVDTTNGGDGLTSLREAVAQASANGVADTIVLDAATTYTLTDCLNGAVTHTAAEPLTIQGAAGTVIHQTCADEGIVVSTDISATSVLTVADLTLTGTPDTGSTTYGAAVFGDGRVVVDRVTITGVEGGPGGSIVDSSFSPGAPTITVVDSTITGNQGTAVGGDFVSVSITGSTITNNVGSGVSLVDGSPLTITDSDISNNTGRGASTTGQGNTIVTVTGSTISDNPFGGLSCSACNSVLVDDSLIDGNGASAGLGGGGGITFTYDYSPIPGSPGVTVTDSTVTNNRANRPGGGISVGTIEPASDPMTQPTTYIARSTVSGNATVGADQHGGGIHLGTTSAIVEQSAIHDNTAGLGHPAGTARGGGLHITESFDDGIPDGRDLILNTTTFEGNEAPGNGGGAYLDLDGRMESVGVSAENNTSGGQGGAIYSRMWDASFDDASVIGNTAEMGGGLAVHESPTFTTSFRVSGSPFAGNTATGRGGGAYVDDATLRFTNSTVSGNSAPEGGGVSVGEDPMGDWGSLELLSTTAVGNSAGAGAHVQVLNGELLTHASVLVDGAGGGTGCVGTLLADGYTFTDDATCALDATDVVSADDPQLGPLGSDGGTTLTHLPAAESPLGGLIPAADCPEPVDQRGVVRPQGDGCEPGSVEVAEAAPAAPIDGGAGSDALVGTDGDDVIRGFGGTDLLLGLAGDDVLEGGAGLDLLFGGDGDDVLRGGDGPDLLVGGPGVDHLEGGGANDLLVGGPEDTFDGGAGFFDLCLIEGVGLTFC